MALTRNQAIVMDIPVLTRQQVRDVDRRAIEDYGMTGLVLMENAARGCVDAMLDIGIVGKVAICCYKGNNGGDGFAMARRLDLFGFDVQVLLWGPETEITGDAGANLSILKKADIPLHIFGDDPEAEKTQALCQGADWIVDAMLGTGAKGEPRSPLPEVIQILNQSVAKKLAVDIPSGLDCDTGVPADATFRANHTCTFVAAKPGLMKDIAQPYVGKRHIIDIGAPRKLIDEVLAIR